MAAKPTKDSPAELLDRLETRHEDLLGRIEDLNGQIEKALAEITSDAGSKAA